jgi:putative AdoMet-dependent methyltransferase
MTMRSRHAAKFNHDPWAADYDEDVTKEENPIRAGYDRLLSWTVEQAKVGPQDTVIDLGSGTGNTSARLPAVGRLICVDLSTEMTEIARPKLSHLARVEFVLVDLLEYFAALDVPSAEAVISTYAIHHLTEDEKPTLFGSIAKYLAPGGRAVFGDLMFENEIEKEQLVRRFEGAGQTELVHDIEDEFFWYVDSAVESLQCVGLEVLEVERFSSLSWGICAQKPDPANRRVHSATE